MKRTFWHKGLLHLYGDNDGYRACIQSKMRGLEYKLDECSKFSGTYTCMQCFPPDKILRVSASVVHDVWTTMFFQNKI